MEHSEILQYLKTFDLLLLKEQKQNKGSDKKPLFRFEREPLERKSKKGGRLEPRGRKRLYIQKP